MTTVRARASWCQTGEPARGLEVLSEVVAGSRAVRWRAGEFYAVWLGEAYLMVGDQARAGGSTSSGPWRSSSGWAPCASRSG